MGEARKRGPAVAMAAKGAAKGKCWLVIAVRGAPQGSRVVIQVRRGRRWRAAGGRRVKKGASRTRVRCARRFARARMRVVLIKGKRPLARSRPIRQPRWQPPTRPQQSPTPTPQRAPAPPSDPPKPMGTGATTRHRPPTRFPTPRSTRGRRGFSPPQPPPSPTRAPRPGRPRASSAASTARPSSRARGRARTTRPSPTASTPSPSAP